MGAAVEAGKYTDKTIMDENTLSRLAFDGVPPESAMPYDWLYWYRMRDIYIAAGRGKMTVEAGRAAKRDAVCSWTSEREEHERSVLLWKRLEPAATAYAKERTIENADAMFEALYRLPSSDKHDYDIPAIPVNRRTK